MPTTMIPEDSGEHAANGAANVVAADVHTGGGYATASGSGVAQKAVGAGLRDKDT